MEEDEVVQSVPVRRRIAMAALLAGGVAAIGLLAGWIERKPIVAHFVDRRLAEAHVPASYTLTAIGPFVQRLDNVRIGDPGAPDLVAKSVILELGYGLGGPYLHAVTADGVRLKARVVDGKVSLGAIDRLLPKTSGSAPLALPDMAVALTDAQVALDTPAGAVGAVIAGSGNLQDGFHGRMTARAPLLAAGHCAIRGLAADVAVHIRDKRPTLGGPIDLAALACPDAALRLGAGRAVIDARLATSLDRGEGGVSLAGFGGTIGPARFDAISGLITASGDRTRWDGATVVSLAGLAVPAGHAAKTALDGRFRFLPGAAGLVFSGTASLTDAAIAAARRKIMHDSLGAMDGSPLEPLARKFGAAADRLLADANAAGHVALTVGGPEGTAISVRTLALGGRGGSFVRMADGDGFGWQARDRAWRVDGHVTTGGGGLPALDIRLDQAVAGAPVSGVARLEPYAAGSARLALTPVRFAVSGKGTRFDTVLTFDGPLPSGQVSGLVLPVSGTIDPRGGVVIGAGCVPVAFRAARAGGMSLDPARARLCGIDGAPLVSKPSGGPLRYGAIGAGLHLTGHSGAAPLSVASDRAEISAAGLSVRKLAVRLGEGEGLTRLDLDTLDGRYKGGVLSGPFEGASAQIGHVPLLLDKMAGDWEFAAGALVLSGGITISDAVPAPRFVPLIAHDATLRFGEGHIDATAELREPKSSAVIAHVDVHHDLADGSGHATLDVPGITFIPKKLQPEALTPLTLGVIASVNGTVAGLGRIDWTAKGVTSTGDFHTDGTDLAAAFGPVSKIAGTIHFSDLLGMATPPRQTVTIAEVNPGVAVSNGVVHYQLLPQQRVRVEDAHWPFAGGTLDLEPTLLSFEQAAQRHLTFRVKSLDAAAFVQQLAFPNISATGTFDGVLPMIFDQNGGRIAGGVLQARRGGGQLAYVGELSSAQIGTMGKLAFDALKKIRYQSLAITLDGRLDGEIVSGVTFDGVRQATGETSIAARMIANLPFRFNIRIRAPFRGLMGSARAFVDPSVLLQNGVPVAPPADAAASVSHPATIQPAESEPVR
ncbi:YdbH domain-containing protein [Sphingomonas abietis]|uniref:YdbH domain-containing protein n=1 Tax=Sphingomonas abietis TaxID=3012344 RepID=A0ABY7NJZ2_9SPHN|nr:YdbH domain-containing protein [Sphingomonas abietis]WBO20917.1 YdbH domain-containing protein [Sphingomonas abietis]